MANLENGKIFFGGEFIIFARLNFVTSKFSNIENLDYGLK